MDNASPTAAAVFIVDDDLQFTLEELSRGCEGNAQWLVEFIEQGALEPLGSAPPDWRFQGSALRRVRTAWRLTQDLQLNAAGAALALDLLDEIEALKRRLRALHTG